MSATLQDLGERELIRRLVHGLPRAETVALGPGDDCAVVHVPGAGETDLLLTSDPVIETVHFPVGCPPAQVGHKALGRVLSDLAAMGGVPLWALVNLVAPPTTPESHIAQLYRGLRELADRFDISIVGGDVARGERIEAHLFAVGSVPRGTALLRSTAAPGQPVYVTGTLGGSRRGKHLAFVPRIKEGIWLRSERWAAATIDITDGLSRDLRRLCEASHTGATIQANRIPIDSDVGLGSALHDGEDFELLFTLRPREHLRFERAWAAAFDVPCTRIGRMTDQPGDIRLLRNDTAEPLHDAGYDHFSSNSSPS